MPGVDFSLLHSACYLFGMKPYAAQLGDQDAIRVLSATAPRLRELAASLGDSRIEEPIAPGKWSPRQIFIHLADCELAFGFRYRQTLAEDNHTVQPFDQDKWAKPYAAYDAQQALDTFTALRNWNLTLIRTLTAEQMSKAVMHPERGQETFRVLIEISAGHDINHLRQLEAVAAKPAA
jgi:DinB superfamily